MKRNLLFMLMMFSIFKASSQGKADYADFNIPTKEDKPFYEKVDSLQKSKAEIYAAARKAFSDLFRSANDVIQMDDKETGQILGKGRLELHHKIQLGVNTITPVWFTLNVQAKDNKYRIQIYDFSVSSTSSDIEHIRKTAKGWRDRFFPAFNDAMLGLITTIQNTINGNTNSDF